MSRKKAENTKILCLFTVCVVFGQGGKYAPIYVTLI